MPAESGEHMAERIQGREIALVATCDESVKKSIEKAFLAHGVSYLIKVGKVRERKNGRYGCRMRYSFYVNRFQTDEARAAVAERALDEDSFTYLA